jgi:hypothetical protein
MTVTVNACQQLLMMPIAKLHYSLWGPSPLAHCLAWLDCNETGKSCDDCCWQRLCKEGCKE